jgi:hypothetical protein
MFSFGRLSGIRLRVGTVPRRLSAKFETGVIWKELLRVALFSQETTQAPAIYCCVVLAMLTVNEALVRCILEKLRDVVIITSFLFFPEGYPRIRLLSQDTYNTDLMKSAMIWYSSHFRYLDRK